MILTASERDSVKAADWLETEALYSGNAKASLEQLRSQVVLEGELEEVEDQEDHDLEPSEDVPSGPSERFASNAASEIKRRIDICGDSYPFSLKDGQILWLRPDRLADPYIICLLAADRELYKPGDDTAVTFEHLTTLALKSFLGGSAVRFGAPRDTMPRAIDDAILELGRLTFGKRVAGWSTYPTDHDIGLDVVGWKEFPDQHNNQLQVYVQCATGEGWLEEKKGEPNLEIWRGLIHLGMPPVLALAIPYVVNDEEKWQRNIAGRLLLDRLRIAFSFGEQVLQDDVVNWSDWAQGRVELAKSRR